MLEALPVHQNANKNILSHRYERERDPNNIERSENLHCTPGLRVPATREDVSVRPRNGHSNKDKEQRGDDPSWEHGQARVTLTQKVRRQKERDGVDAQKAIPVEDVQHGGAWIEARGEMLHPMCTVLFLRLPKIAHECDGVDLLHELTNENEKRGGVSKMILSTEL